MPPKGPEADFVPGDEMPVGAARESTSDKQTTDFTRDARIYEYGSAANPKLAPIPILVHPATLHESGPTAIHPFNISDFLQIDYPCTSPNLMASFVRICKLDERPKFS